MTRKVLDIGFLAIAVFLFSIGLPPLVAYGAEVKNATSTPPIVWSADRPLTWDDFKGQVPPDAPEDVDALSAVGVFSSWEFNEVKSSDCKRGDKKWTCPLTLKSVKAEAKFNPDASWVKPDSKSDDLLKHEQGHFDISEIFARRKQQKMNELLAKTISGEGDTFEAAVADARQKFEKLLHEICDMITNKENKMQESYDDETNHGTNEEQQKKWNKKIADMLKASETSGEPKPPPQIEPKPPPQTEPGK